MNIYKRLYFFLFGCCVFPNVCVGASFTTLNHPKSNGINLELVYPDNWKKLEARQPHVVQAFTFDSRESCSLLIRDIGKKQTINEWKKLFVYDADSVVQDMVRDGSMFFNPKYIHTKYSTFLDGLVIHVDHKLEQAGLTLYGQTDIYVFGYENSTILLQCSAMDMDKEKADKIYEDYKIDFWKIAISIMLPDLYG